MALTSPRIRFNNGYHDAVRDSLNGSPRAIHDTIHDTKHVSPAFSMYYCEGYKAGLVETNYTDDSQAAWEAYLETLTQEQVLSIYQSEVDAYLRTWKKKDRSERIINAARKNAAEVCKLNQKESVMC